MMSNKNDLKKEKEKKKDCGLPYGSKPKSMTSSLYSAVTLIPSPTVCKKDALSPCLWAVLSAI